MWCIDSYLPYNETYINYTRVYFPSDYYEKNSEADPNNNNTSKKEKNPKKQYYKPKQNYNLDLLISKYYTPGRKNKK